MHFSIPDTQDIKGEGNSTFTAYNIHVNGVFHCAVRYSQLHDFHEKLKKEYGNAVPGVFPPKKILSLTPMQVDERREKLEKYIQAVSQDTRLASGPLFNGFFLSAQQETQKQDAEDVQLDLYLLNGHKITVQISSTDQTDDVLEVVASQIELTDDFVYYFALFLIKEEAPSFSIVRKMQDFESPYISLKTAGNKHRIVLRKSFWDSAYDDDLLEDRVAMNLLYVQAVSDIERNWTLATKEQSARLESLKSKGSKKEYLRLARTLKYYGFVHFKPCTADYPAKNTKVLIAAGSKELNFRVRSEDGQMKEGSFKVTRMRCWRITTTVSDPNSDSEDSDKATDLELSFEYLVARDKLQWISVQSDQAILISICLQGMVDELIMKKQGGRMKRPQDRVRGRRSDFKRRDGNIVKSPSDNLFPESPTDESASAAQKAKDSVKKISDKLQSVKPFGMAGHHTSSLHPVQIHSDKLQSVSFKQPHRAKGPSALVENDVFEDIGDDDL
ncbi:sorting nexin-17-like [Glandiceps talaboti]